MRKTTPSSAVEQLLAALLADPRSAASAVSKATDGKSAKDVRSALKSDARFGPPLRAAIRDPKVLQDAPWLVQFLGHLRFVPAVPELLSVWRRRDERVSYQAGQALLRIGEPKALEAMADDLEKTRGTETSVALDAVFVLGPARAYDRLAPLVKSVKSASKLTAPILYRVAEETKPFVTEPRWQALAIEVLRDGPKDALDAARELLTRALTKAQLRAALAPAAPTQAPRKAPVPGAREETFVRARAAVARHLASLPKTAWTPATKKSARELSRLEALIGPLPAFVRAFYECASGLDARGKTARDRKIVCSLTEVCKEARAWARRHDVANAPAEMVPPFLFPISPDGYTKAGFSGGPSIGFEMPCTDDDPALLHLRGNPRFSSFLKRAKA